MVPYLIIMIRFCQREHKKTEDEERASKNDDMVTTKCKEA